jgi:hypothetical protein
MSSGEHDNTPCKPARGRSDNAPNLRRFPGDGLIGRRTYILNSDLASRQEPNQNCTPGGTADHRQANSAAAEPTYIIPGTSNGSRDTVRVERRRRDRPLFPFKPPSRCCAPFVGCSPLRNRCCFKIGWRRRRQSKGTRHKPPPARSDWDVALSV